MVENENVQSVADKNLSGGQPTSDAGASGGPEGGEAAPEAPVLYVYECVSCGHRGEERLPGDSHDGRPSACLACGASVVLEWDGGVTLHADVPRRWGSGTMANLPQASAAASPAKFSSDAPVPALVAEGGGERRSLRWWMVEYLTTFATGAPATLRYKKEDLELFYSWFVWAFGSDDVGRWNRASSNLFVQTLAKETVRVPGRGKKAGEPRWSARSLNRKIDHLRTFAKWVASQVPPLVAGGNPMQGVKRFDVPVLQAKRLTEKEVIRLETAARGLAGTRIRRDRKRTDLGVMETRSDARPARDLAVYKLLIGTGLRVSAVAKLDVSQFAGRRLVRVKEKGSQEREVVMSSEAARAVELYLASEREKDAAAYGGDCAPLFLAVPHQAKNRNPDADGRMSSRALFAVVRRLAEDALGESEAKRIHPHLFRHHVGYLMNEKGGITAVQKQLAHRNIAYSAVYAQRTDEELERILDGHWTDAW